MDTVRDLIQRLASLTPEEIEQLREQILAEFDRLDVDTASVEDVALMQELKGFGEQLQAERANRAAVEEQAQADRQSARDGIQVLRPAAETDETPAEETPAEPEAEAEQSDEPAEETPPAEAVPAEPVTATGQVQRMAARQGAPSRSPEAAGAAPSRRRSTLTAAGALRHDGIIEDRATLATEMADLLTRLHPHSKARGDVIVASLTYDYPEERILGSDKWENERKMDAVSALTATGGICLPVNVDYAVPTWATADRPIRDALPAYQATRGGVRYVQPPDIGALAGATGIWTEATDLAPGAQTKPLVSISCGTEQLVYVEAVSTRLGFGNMFSRFAPEQVAANTDLAIAAAARVAENNLLNLIAAQCVSNVTVAKALSATRDIITAIHAAVAAYRNVHRIPPTQTLTAIFPEWIKPLLKIDLARETAHDNASDFNVLKLTDAQAVSLLEDSTGLNCVFHIDGQPSSVSGGVAQVFTQQATGALNVFPTTCVWYLFAEGMFQFLDAGRLDLGVVRDSTLDATNDYETFVETFENVAFRGFANGALQMVSTLCATGTSTTPISFTTCA